MNTALIIQNINNRPYSLKTKTKANKIDFPFNCMLDNTNLKFSKPNVEIIFLFNKANELNIWGKDCGSQLVQGQSAKEIINKLSFLLDK